jgi:hypothetical protein
MSGLRKRRKKSRVKLYLEFIPFVGLYKLLRLAPLRFAYWISRAVFALNWGMHLTPRHTICCGSKI